MIYELDNSVMPYAWGSTRAIAELQGRPTPSPGPEAELWMGAHPDAPSHVVEAGVRRSLRELVRENAAAVLGESVAREYAGELPFLLKVLAAETPLSLQAHPSREQAETGFADEERRGVPRKDPKRNYKDRNHKPELLVALGPFVALYGFREVATTRRLFAELGARELDRYLEPLADADAGRGLSRTLQGLIEVPEPTRPRLVTSLLEAIERSPADTEFADELSWAKRLGASYPRDTGVVSALLLNLVRLESGQGIFLPAGNLHAYLRGVGIEIMASSDNVLRGGLTPKHVDAQELLRVLDFRELPRERLEPVRGAAGELEYLTPAPDFRLSRLDVAGRLELTPRRGPEILLVTEGSVRVAGLDGELELARGASAFVPAGETRVTLRGNATLFRARVPA